MLSGAEQQRIRTRSSGIPQLPGFSWDLGEKLARCLCCNRAVKRVAGMLLQGESTFPPVPEENEITVELALNGAH